VKRVLYRISTIFFCLMLSACQIVPQNHWEQIQRDGKLIVGTSADYSPFEYVDKQGQFAGFDIDIVDEIGSRLGLEIVIIDMPFDSIIPAVQSGKVDIAIAAFNYSEERDEFINFTKAYYYQENGFLVSTSFEGLVKEPEDAALYSLGVQTGSMADTWATDILVGERGMDEENLFRYDRVDQAALDILNGRIDILMADYYPLLTLVEEYDDLKIIYHGEVAAGPMMMIIPESDIETKIVLDGVINDMIRDGFVDEIATRHFSSIE
jgi:polar amino acid transport system substrate-binding protein